MALSNNDFTCQCINQSVIYLWAAPWKPIWTNEIEKVRGSLSQSKLGTPKYQMVEISIFGKLIWKKPFSQIIWKETRNDHDELKHLSHEKLILSSLPTISFLFSMPILRRESTLLTNFNFIPFQNWFLTLYI